MTTAFDGMCQEEKGLVELPVAEGYGLVVGRLRPGAPVDIDDYVGPGLAEELALLDFADWELYGEPHVHEVAANWKVTLDTYRENYHFDYLHRTTLADQTYLRPGLSEEETTKLVDMAPWICETVVDGEDFWVKARTGPGLRSGLLDTVVFGRNEPAPQHLHRGFDAALEDARR